MLANHHIDGDNVYHGELSLILLKRCTKLTHDNKQVDFILRKIHCDVIPSKTY